MKIANKFWLVAVSSLAVVSAQAIPSPGGGVYNTGFSTSLNGSGQLVDNLWTINQVQNAPSGLGLPSTPYAAFTLPSATITWPWDTSAPPAGANSFTTLWDSNNQPAFSGGDTVGMVTTYTLNFNALAGSYALYFEDDNYVSMYLGAVAPANMFFSEAPQNAYSEFGTWHSTTVNVVNSGANQLNIMVYNYPYPSGNYTGLRVNFSTIPPVPEPSSMALVVGGLMTLVAAAKRRK